MVCDLRFKNLNVYLDVERDIPEMWKDFKSLRHPFKSVKWYLKPVWLVLMTLSLVGVLIIVALVFVVFAVYAINMVLRYCLDKITPDLGR